MTYPLLDKTFQSFTEAAAYAKRRAQELGLSVRLERFNENWMVHEPAVSSQRSDYPNSNSAPLPDRDLGESDYLKQKKEQLAQEDLHREFMQRQHEDQKAYEEAIKANKVKEQVCEACFRPISKCIC